MKRIAATTALLASLLVLVEADNNLVVSTENQDASSDVVTNQSSAPTANEPLSPAPTTNVNLNMNSGGQQINWMYPLQPLLEYKMKLMDDFMGAVRRSFLAPYRYPYLPPNRYRPPTTTRKPENNPVSDSIPAPNTIVSRFGESEEEPPQEVPKVNRQTINSLSFLDVKPPPGRRIIGRDTKKPYPSTKVPKKHPAFTRPPKQHIEIKPGRFATTYSNNQRNFWNVTCRITPGMCRLFNDTNAIPQTRGGALGK